VKYEYSCILVNLKVGNWKEIQQLIDPADLSGDGLETEPHVSIMMGIEPDVKSEDIIKIVQDWPRPSITLQEFSIFENPEYDVLKIGVESFDLGAYRQLAMPLPNYQEFQLFQPHLTVAYLKPGTGRKYLDTPLQIAPKEYQATNFTISMANGDSIPVKPKFVILNYENFHKAISHDEFKKLHIEKTGQIATVLNSAFISGHSYNNKTQQTHSGLGASNSNPQVDNGADSSLS